MLVGSRICPRDISVAVAVFGSLMVTNVGRMIAAMAMITGSVAPSGVVASERQCFATARRQRRRGLPGRADRHRVPGGQIENFSTVGWIACSATLVSLWLAGRIVPPVDHAVSAESISLAAAAEAEGARRRTVARRRGRGVGGVREVKTRSVQRVSAGDLGGNTFGGARRTSTSSTFM